MRHRVKKITFKKGKDASLMMTRKLVTGFIMRGKVETTLKRAKVIQQEVERLAEKSKKDTEASRNFMAKKLGNNKISAILFKDVAPVIKEKKGGYIKIRKTGYRESDGSQLAVVEWVYPIIKEVTETIAKLEEKPPVKTK